MFGSIAVEQWLYQTAAATPEVVALVGDEIHVPYAPQETGSPYLVAYRTDAVDHPPEGGVGLPVVSETLTYSVAIVDEGGDKFALLPAAQALHAALQGQNVEVTVTDADGIAYGDFQLLCFRAGELPNDDIATPDDGVAYVALGGLYEIEVQVSG